MASEIDVGRLVAGKYELVRLIGKGAMGEVWLATHNSLGGEFAIKLVRTSDDEEDESAAGRFQLEAQISAKLSRKTRHIISVSDHGEEDGLAYLVMELLEGESLDARIERLRGLPLPEVTAIVMQIARALGQAHAEQIFHRDLKPANVFLTKDEDGRMLVKLLDFGIARAAKPFRTRSPFMTGKDMVLGTPSYMSPEQARGLDTLDHRCDLWALSVVAYEMLTGTIPWEGESVEDIFLSICTHRWVPILNRRSNLPFEIESVFSRSFTVKLDERFPTAAELSEAFELLVDPMEVDAALGGPPPGSARRIGSAPDLSAHRPPQRSDPAVMAVMTGVPGVPGRPSSGELGSDPVGMAVGGPTLANQRYKRSNSGWIIAAIAALATIGIVVLAVSAFGSRDKQTTKNPPADVAPITPSTNDSTNVPPPVEPVTPLPIETTSPAVKNTAPRVSAPPGRPTTPPVVPPPPTPPPPVTTHAAPHPPPTPPPSATVQKPKDKGEVF